jgi:DNA helicase-2/ATP-dependent DNA helicase PcrA
MPYRHALSTALDEDNSPATVVFRNILSWLFSLGATRRGFVDEHVDPSISKMTQRMIMNLLGDLQSAVPFEDDNWVKLLIHIATIITGKQIPRRAEARLDSLAATQGWVDFMPPFSEQIQLMTIHKAKGLEFDIVFHLDLYEFVLPQYKREQEPEEANLHYVALTRAKYACILCSSTLRHNRNGVIAASDSPFLYRQGLAHLRERW